MYLERVAFNGLTDDGAREVKLTIRESQEHEFDQYEYETEEVANALFEQLDQIWLTGHATMVSFNDDMAIIIVSSYDAFDFEVYDTEGVEVLGEEYITSENLSDTDYFG